MTEVNEKELYFQCNTQERYVDNLGVLGKVIEQESYAIRNGMKEFGQVMNQFSLGYEADGPKTLTPREILGIIPSMKDIGYIEYVYKKLAKEHHPDVNGDPEKFKEINEAFNQLKKEIENE